jgi:hypothetical protein
MGDEDSLAVKGGTSLAVYPSWMGRGTDDLVDHTNKFGATGFGRSGWGTEQYLTNASGTGYIFIRSNHPVHGQVYVGQADKNFLSCRMYKGLVGKSVNPDRYTASVNGTNTTLYFYFEYLSSSYIIGNISASGDLLFFNGATFQAGVDMNCYFILNGNSLVSFATGGAVLNVTNIVKTATASISTNTTSQYITTGYYKRVYYGLSESEVADADLSCDYTDNTLIIYEKNSKDIIGNYEFSGIGLNQLLDYNEITTLEYYRNSSTCGSEPARFWSSRPPSSNQGSGQDPWPGFGSGIRNNQELLGYLSLLLLAPALFAMAARIRFTFPKLRWPFRLPRPKIPASTFDDFAKVRTTEPPKVPPTPPVSPPTLTPQPPSVPPAPAAAEAAGKRFVWDVPNAGGYMLGSRHGDDIRRARGTHVGVAPGPRLGPPKATGPVPKRP